MDELEKIAKELEEHPLKHRLVSEKEMFEKKKREPNKIAEIKAYIIKMDKAIIKHNKKIKDNKLTGRQRAHLITIERSRIRVLKMTIQSQIEKLCEM